MSATDGDETSRPDWVGQDALRWVIDEAPVPVDLAWTLTVIARKCDQHGKGSFQSKQTLSERTGKSEDQVSRDVRELLKRGLIRLGDQALPGKCGYKPGQWPTVYDVAMEIKGPKPARKSKNPTGRKKPDDAEPEQTPRMDAGGGMEAGGGMHAPGTPRMDADPTPRMDAPQRSPSKNPLNNPSSLSARTSVPAPRDSPDEDRERDDSTSSEDPNLTWHERLVIEAHCPPEQAAAVVAWIQREYPDRGPGWWRTLVGTGDLVERVREALEALASGGQSGCGNCGGTGKVTAHDQHDNPIPADCPFCTPLSTDRIRAFTDLLAGQPDCGHGHEGGDEPMPGTGWMACPICRKRSGYVSAEVKNQQGRRGDVAVRVNGEFGSHKAGWDRRESAEARKAREWLALPGHQAYRNPEDQSVYDDWSNR